MTEHVAAVAATAISSFAAGVIRASPPSTGNATIDAITEVGAFAVAVVIGYYFLTRSDRREAKASDSTRDEIIDLNRRHETEMAALRAERDDYRRRYEKLLERLAREGRYGGALDGDDNG